MRKIKQPISIFIICSILITGIRLTYCCASSEVMWGDQQLVKIGVISQPSIAEITTLHHKDEIKSGYILYAQCVQQNTVVVIFSDPGIQLVVFDCDGTFKSGYSIPKQKNDSFYMTSTGLSPDGSILIFNYKARRITRLTGELTSFCGCEIYQPTQSMLMNPGIHQSKSDWSVSQLQYDLLQVTHVDGRKTTLLHEPPQWSVWDKIEMAKHRQQQQNWIFLGGIFFIIVFYWFFRFKMPHAH